MGGAPSLREEEVVAAGLSLNPDREPGVKVDSEDKALETDRIIATGVTSAWLRQLGEVGPAPLEFCRSRRKQTQRDGLTVKKRSRDDSDIVVSCGIPSSSAARTVLALMDDGEDFKFDFKCVERRASERPRPG